MARFSLTTHWKFLRLSRAVGSRVLARGILETLWEPCWLAGDPYVGTSTDIEALCEWKGEAGALTKALLMSDAKGAGFIEPYDGRVPEGVPHYQVHDFFDHCPQYAKRKTPIAKTCIICGDEYTSHNPKSQVCGPRCRMRLHRERQREASDASVTLGDDPENRDRNGSSRGDDLDRNKTVTEPRSDVDNSSANSSCDDSGDALCVTRDDCYGRRQEKSREEKIRITPGTPRYDCAAAEKSADAPATTTPVDRDDYTLTANSSTAPAPRRRKRPPPDTDPSPVVLTFPVTGEGSPTWPLHDAQVQRWASLYPALDVLAEARACLAWIEADLTRRKTYGGMTKCLVSWLNRSVNSPRGRSPTLITGSLKTAGNKAALTEFLRRRGHAVD